MSCYHSPLRAACSNNRALLDVRRCSPSPRRVRCVLPEDVTTREESVTLEKFGDAGRSYQHLRTPAGRVRVHGGLPRGGCCCYYESTPPAVRPLCNGEQPCHACGRGHVDSREIARSTRDIGACARRCLCNLHVSLNVQGVCLRHGSNAAQQPTTQLRRGDAIAKKSVEGGECVFSGVALDTHSREYWIELIALQLGDFNHTIFPDFLRQRPCSPY